MGLIKEPIGVDFIIAPALYTDEDRAEVSAFFRRHKELKTKKIIEPSDTKIKHRVFA